MPPKIRGSQTLRPRSGDDVANAFNRKVESIAAFPSKVISGVSEMVDEGAQNLRDALPAQVSDQDSKLSYPKQRRSKENEAYLRSYQSRQRLQKAQANREKAEKAIDADEQIVRGIDKNQRDDLKGISEVASTLSTLKKKPSGNTTTVKQKPRLRQATRISTPKDSLQTEVDKVRVRSYKIPKSTDLKQADPAQIKKWEEADKARKAEAEARARSWGLDLSKKVNDLPEVDEPGGYDFTDARSKKGTKSSAIKKKWDLKGWDSKTAKPKTNSDSTRVMGKKTAKDNARWAKNEEHNRKKRAKLKAKLEKKKLSSNWREIVGV